MSRMNKEKIIPFGGGSCAGVAGRARRAMNRCCIFLDNRVRLTREEPPLVFLCDPLSTSKKKGGGGRWMVRKGAHCFAINFEFYWPVRSVFLFFSIT